MNYNYALLQLASKIELKTGTTQIVSFPNNDILSTGSCYDLIGWANDGKLSRQEFCAVNYATCSSSYRGWKVIRSNMICASSIADDVVNGCFTDDGSPLMVSGNDTLLAISSFQYCGQTHPDIFSNINWNLTRQWIRDVSQI